MTKRYGRTLAVDDLSFDVKPGQVTGFLGPNGAGKSTTMRLILALDRADRGSVRIAGHPYSALRSPLYEVGALLEATGAHPGRTAYHHLLWLAQSNRIARRRLDEVLDLVGLAAVARKRVGGFSLGMAQRLGLAAALLGDPPVLMLDEPMNGLDPEGISWIRTLLRSLAAEGHTVFISSHLMSEMAQLADHLVVIGRGRLIADTTVDEFIERRARPRVRVRSPNADGLARLLAERGATVSVESPLELTVTGVDTRDVGDLTARHGLTVHELYTEKASLEAAFLELTGEALDHRSAGDGAKAAEDHR